MLILAIAKVNSKMQVKETVVQVDTAERAIQKLRELANQSGGNLSISFPSENMIGVVAADFSDLPLPSINIA